MTNPTNSLTTKNVRNIETGLINKEEIFKILALAEATQLPTLLVGPPGVGKTKTVVDYAKAWLNRDGKMSKEDFMNKLYILETDEGTKSSEVKGMPDLTKLFTSNEFDIYAPIADAEVVIINEIDKASANIRNSLLGIMNERFLFNGKHKIPCKWKLFIATCNEIPKDEMDSPFWDRFMIKETVNRVNLQDMLTYYDNGGKDFKTCVSVNVPTKEELALISVPTDKMSKFLDVAHSKCTDRTLSFVPTIAKAVSYIWQIPLNRALGKTADIMVSQEAAGKLMNNLMSKEMKTLLKEIESLHSIKDAAEIDLAIARIEGMANSYASKKKLTQEELDDLEKELTTVLSTHEVKKRSEEIESLLAEALDAELPSANLPF